MSHVELVKTEAQPGETLEEYRNSQKQEPRWKHVTVGVSEADLNHNFEFLNAAVVNRSAKAKDQKKEHLLLTTTGLFGPIRSGTMVHLDRECPDIVVQSDFAPTHPELDLISRLNRLHDISTGNPPDRQHALPVNGFWTASVDGAGVTGLDGSANVFGSTGQLICDVVSLDFPLLKYGPGDAQKQTYLDTLAYYGGTLLAPKEEFALGFNQDLWGIQYDQKLPEYVTEYQFGPTKGGGLFVEHHPFPHIWLPATGKDPEFKNETVSRIILGRRLDSTQEDGYYRTIHLQQYHFTMFEVPGDGSALAVRPQCIHNDSFTEGAQTVFLGNTAANTVALRHSAPINQMSVDGTPVDKLPTKPGSQKEDQ